MKEIKYYGITIAGIQVTSENCNNITGDGIRGSVSYNPETNTLTLDNAIIVGGIYFGFGTNRLENITITLIGENFVTTIWTVSGTKIINGSGSLEVHRTIECYNEENTIIEDCTIIVSRYCHKTVCGEYGKLTIKNANISSVASEFAIGTFASIELIDCEIKEPVNAQIIDNEFDGEKGKYICDADGTPAKEVVIKKRNKK